MTRLGVAVLLVLISGGALCAQPSQVSVSAAAQVYTADRFRLGTQNRVEPDLGISWLKPGLFGGTLGLDVNLVRRDDRIQVGRGLFSLKGVQAAGFTWDLNGGDTGTPPFVPDFGFSNLHAPILTVAGGSIEARRGRTTLRVAGGRSTQNRSVFGTDFVDLRQTLFQADAGVRVSERVHLTTHGSSVTNGDLGTYPVYVDWSRDLGAGLTIKPRPNWQLAFDGGVSRFQRRGAPDADVAPSWLVGTSVTGRRGRFEVNAQRFSVGRFAGMNYPYNDRQGVFASGDLDLNKPVRVFGGVEVARTNLDPAAAAQASIAIPEGTQARGYGGVRLQFAQHSTVTVRTEGGGRNIVPSRFSPGFESDTGALSVEWQGRLPRATVFSRYERRSNVDASYAPSSFRQHEVSSQIFFHLQNNRELFGQVFAIRRDDRTGGGETEWYAGGGVQQPVASLALRVEGTFGRTSDWTSRRAANRQMIIAGVSGQLARRLYLSADIVVNHAALDLPGGSAWTTRSIVRLTRTLSYGATMLTATGLAITGPTGSVDSRVFVDWDADGEVDPGDDPAQGVVVFISGLGAAPTGRDGRAVFGRVPVGERLVSLDLSTVPADFDLPDRTTASVDVAKSHRTAASFGLIPVGSIEGFVCVDRDGDGRRSAGDQPVRDAVVTLDDGERTALVRDGAFRFDNVRLGSHAVSVVMESLGDGAMLAGPARAEVELTREQRAAGVTFLVHNERRPEIRKVFPGRKVAVPNAADQTEATSGHDGPEPLR